METYIAFCILGFSTGIGIGSFITKKSFMLNLKYKARTKIDLNEDGIFYEIRFSKRNGNYDELVN